MAAKGGLSLSYWLPLLCFWTISALYLAVCPFTKVEESFGMQAIHDLLRVKQLSDFDHFEFPGVVPRTFLGPLIVATALKPLAWFVRSGLLLQMGARAVLGLLISLCWHRLVRAIERIHGSHTAWLFVGLSLSQFHLPFYATRTLPNTWALGLVFLAYADLLEDKKEAACAWLVIAAACFRFELAIPLALWLLVLRRRSWSRLVILAVMTMALTVAVDSHYWGRRWMWPEWQVFWFNVVLNRSHEWGTAPWHWYLSRGLPSACLLAYPLSLLRIPSIWRRFWPMAVFLGVMSWLPHKELRFIFPLIPLVNLTAALTLTRLKQRKLAKLIMATTLATSLFRLRLAQLNYPGGRAISSLVCHGGERIHLDTFVAMTGVTRFLHPSGCKLVSKQEGQVDHSLFTHLITERPEVEGFEPIKVIHGYSHLRLGSWPYFELVTKPLCYLHRQREWGDHQ